ncbi:MAG: hypothetical protein ACI9YH_001076 [Colwellia sp.]|jgi:hypothetical protein
MGHNVPPFGAITIIINAKCKMFAKQEYSQPKLFFKNDNNQYLKLYSFGALLAIFQSTEVNKVSFII